MNSHVLVAMAALATPLTAQSSRLTKLAPPDGQLMLEFSRIESVRELSDGRLVISEPSDRGVILVEFRSERVILVSRRGHGPREYASASTVYALAGDSSLMADNGNRRWLLFQHSEIVAAVPADDPAVAATQVSILGADSLGRVFALRRNPPNPGQSQIGFNDSSTIVLVTRKTGSADTIGTVRRQPGKVLAQYSPDGSLLSTKITLNPLVAGEKVILFRDGWVAVVRVDPYRVDWRAPRGTWLRGTALPVPSIAMDARERRAQLMRRNKNAPRSSAASAPEWDWPAHLPLLHPSGSLVASSDGRVLIPRYPSASQPGSVYDVVNRTGKLERQILLGSNQRIVGFGAAAVYVVETDDDGIERLSRHPWNLATDKVP